MRPEGGVQPFSPLWPEYDGPCQSDLQPRREPILRVEISSGSNSVRDSFGDGDDFRIQDSPIDTDRLFE